MRYKSNHLDQFTQEQLLFDTAQYVKRPKPNQKEFEKLILPYVPIFRIAFEQAASELWKLRTNNPPHHFLSRFNAMFFNGKYIGILKDLIGRESFGITAEGRDYLRIGNYIVFFKKVGANLEPKNLRTENTDRINAQYARITEEPCSIIFIGYKPSIGNWNELNGLYAIYQDKEQSQHWVSDLLAIQQIKNHEITIDDSEFITVNLEQPLVRIRQREAQTE